MRWKYRLRSQRRRDTNRKRGAFWERVCWGKSNNLSMWVVGWGPDTIQGLYPSREDG